MVLYIATKGFNFNGKVAKVVLSAAGNGIVPNATNAGNSMTIAFQDSAGTTLPIATYTTASYLQSITKNSGTSGAGIGIGTVTYPTASAAGSMLFTCGSINATGQVQVDYTNSDGSVVTSNALPVTCSGSPYTYSAKLDKSTYKPGDIATLTVTFADSKGALAADVYTTTAGVFDANSSAISGTSANIPNIVGSNLTNTSGTTTTAGSATDVTTNGVAKYKFIVGSTTGSYQLIVDFPKVDTNGAGASLLVPYTIADGSTSLNDVLKGIVDLIASINKQIAALAKLVTKKK
jgi:hypothetical protein